MIWGFKKEKKEVTLEYHASSGVLAIAAKFDGAPLSFFSPPSKLKGVNSEGIGFDRFMGLRQFLSVLTSEQAEEIGLATESDDTEVHFQWAPLLAAHSAFVPSDETDDGEESLQALLSTLTKEIFQNAKPIKLSLENYLGFRDAEFRVDPHFSDESGNRLYLEEGAGGQISRSQLYLLSKPQYDLAQAVRAPWPRDHQEKHLHWADLQRQSEALGVHLSPFLDSERASYLDSVSPTVTSPEPGVLELGVQFDHPESASLVASIDKEDQARQHYTFMDQGGGRRRTFLSGRVRTAVQGIRKHRRLEGAEAARFVQDPESFLPFAGVDLTEFSDRVSQVGFHVYRPVEVVGGAGGVGEYVWTAGEAQSAATVVMRFAPLSPGGKPLEIDVSDPEDERNLRLRVAEAFEKGEEYLEVLPGHMVPLGAFPASFLRPPTSDDEEEKRSKSLTVQVVTNIDTLEYGESGEKFVESPDDLALPASLSPDIQLHWYQKAGYQKIGKVALGRVTNASGFLLADDMGLGKTLQILTVLARLIEDGRPGPFLIIAKPVLLENWTREMFRFFPGVFYTPLIISSSVSLESLKNAQVVLGSYDQLRRRQLDLARVNWDTVILDEAQKIKDPATQTTRASWALPATTRLAMTGTPIENSLTDLWSISNFFQPGLLSSLSDFRDSHQDSQGNVMNLPLLKENLDPLFLRRTKDEVAKDLPPLTEQRFELTMGGRQLELYEREMVARREGIRQPLDTVNRLLQLCTHASLIDYSELWPCKADQCPKLFKTLSILDDVKAAGEKVLIFTKFLKAQSAVRQAVEDRFGITVPVINGSTKDRQQVIDRFSEVDGFAVLVLSPEAAGVGLNITAANHVIHFTRSWNPAIEKQSTDRAFRLGQTRPVTVYYPIVVHPERGTIEERLDELLKRKLAIFHDIFVPSSEKQISLKELLG